ncbi:hypothetical protein Sjap_005076 [Stephania japonica]|uniref:NAC domain-containing protein n=1 Tax=Stephania japonica TaxID=461633 RepID=A0AAP0K4X0_9MAGN
MGYLQAKASNIQLPFVDPVVEFDVFTTHPTQLHMQQRLNATSTHLYFYVTKSGRNRSLWKWVLACKHSATAILNRKREVIGYRSMLVYYNNALNTNTKKRDKSEKTRWILHEYTLPEAHNMSSKGHKEPFWTICKIGETGRTFGGDNYQSSSVPSQQQKQPQSNKAIEHGINGASSSQEVDQQAAAAKQSNVMMVEACNQYSNKVRVWPTYALMISAATTTIELIVLPDDEDDACNEDMENWIGNFDYCMDMIKELHDEVYDANGNSELEIDEQPFPKRVKYYKDPRLLCKSK